MKLGDRVKNREIGLHEIDDEAGSISDAVAMRREALEDISGLDLESISSYNLDEADASKRNIENMIGAVQVPLGVAGPLEIKGDHAEGDYFVPLATTEGALVASVNRGASAITESGGCSAWVYSDEMTRAPVFRVRDTSHGSDVVDWIDGNRDSLRDAAEATTDHGELSSIRCFPLGDSLFVRFGFDTKDAMGMNMVTVASKKAAELIEEETGASLVALSGNLCTDKKPAVVDSLLGRGRSVVADVVLSGSVLKDKLKTSAVAVDEVNKRKNLLGSARAGSLGFNAQIANVLAAVYLATGQDAAQVVEGSMGFTSTDVRDGDLYISVTVPAVEVGTVGGGTGLGPQGDALSMLGVEGGGDPAGSNALELAEIVASSCLCGEISLLSALASRHLDEAHESLGR